MVCLFTRAFCCGLSLAPFLGVLLAVVGVGLLVGKPHKDAEMGGTNRVLVSSFFSKPIDTWKHVANNDTMETWTIQWSVAAIKITSWADADVSPHVQTRSPALPTNRANWHWCINKEDGWIHMLDIITFVCSPWEKTWTYELWSAILIPYTKLDTSTSDDTTNFHHPLL